MGQASHSPAKVPGVTFCLDTIEPSGSRGLLTPISGRVSYASGRGRLDIEAVRHAPLTIVNGARVAPPAGRAGDYYLFSDSALVLVRPRTRTYAQLRITGVEAHASPALLPGERLTAYGPRRVDTVAAGPGTVGLSRLPLAIQMHVDVRHVASSPTSLARARLTLVNAPAGEATAARWYGAARLLDALAPSLPANEWNALQLTAAVILEPRGANDARALIGTGQPMSCVARGDIDSARLVLPRGYRRTVWPEASSSQ